MTSTGEPKMVDEAPPQITMAVCRPVSKLIGVDHSIEFRIYSLPELSPRQKDVMLGIVRGLTDRQIGLQLGLTRGTVNLYRERICRKLGARTAIDAVRIALERTTKVTITVREGES